MPQRAHGLQVMSIGFMIEEDTPMIWRGPMVTSALQQLLTETNWEKLDYMVIDLPPGTGDIQLTLSQKIPVAGCVIVTTPQDIATLDARKAVQMFRKVEMSVLGVVENMSTHICSECGHEEPIFGSVAGSAWRKSTMCHCWASCRWLCKSVKTSTRACLRSWRIRIPNSGKLPGGRPQLAARLSTTKRSLSLNLASINVHNT